ALHERARHLPLVEDALIAVHVGEEQVERLDALLEPEAHRLPLRSGDDARDQIEREDPLGRRGAAGHRERYAAAQEGGVGELLAARDLAAAELVEPAHDRGDRRVRPALRVDEFVERARQWRVSLEEKALLCRQSHPRHAFLYTNANRANQCAPFAAHFACRSTSSSTTAPAIATTARSRSRRRSCDCARPRTAAPRSRVMRCTSRLDRTS